LLYDKDGHGNDVDDNDDDDDDDNDDNVFLITTVNKG